MKVISQWLRKLWYYRFKRFWSYRYSNNVCLAMLVSVYHPSLFIFIICPNQPRHLDRLSLLFSLSLRHIKILVLPPQLCIHIQLCARFTVPIYPRLLYILFTDAAVHGPCQPISDNDSSHVTTPSTNGRDGVWFSVQRILQRIISYLVHQVLMSQVDLKTILEMSSCNITILRIF